LTDGGGRAGPGIMLVFVGRRLLVRPHGEGVALPAAGELAGLAEAVGEEAVTDLGPWQGGTARAADLPAAVEPPRGLEALGLRQLHDRLPRELYRLAGRALQLVEWRRTHRFCGACGSGTVLDLRHRAMACRQCGQLHFPRLAPAVITLVERGDRVLLGRSPHFPSGVYSTLAGFVDPGESAEEAVHREVMEEVGVRVEDVRWYGSQPWPFPHSLMLGFTARWAEGEIELRDGELEDARWFSADELPTALPPTMSIARWLIDDFLKRCGHPSPEGGREAPPEAYPA